MFVYSVGLRLCAAAPVVCAKDWFQTLGEALGGRVEDSGCGTRLELELGFGGGYLAFERWNVGPRRACGGVGRACLYALNPE